MAKIFISHAWEDKHFAKPLADALGSNHKVWFDEYSLNMGDSLRAKIDEGLASTDFGVVVLSHRFFNKHWTQNELDGLMTLERTHRKLILPIWLDINKSEVEAYSPILANRIASLANKGVQAVVEEINRSISAAEQQRSLDENKAGKEALLALVKTTKGKQFEERLFMSEAGVALFRQAINAIFSEIQRDIDEVNKAAEFFRIKKETDLCTVYGPKRLSARIEPRDMYLNSIRTAQLGLVIFQRSDYGFEVNQSGVIEDKQYCPICRAEGEFMWQFPEGGEPRTNRDVAQDILKRFSLAVSDALNNN